MLRKRGIDIVIALDFSKSMLARDVHPSRIKRAKAELEQLLQSSGKTMMRSGRARMALNWQKRWQSPHPEQVLRISSGTGLAYR